MKPQEDLDYLKWLKDQDFKVLGWHLNGDTEPLINFLNNIDVDVLQQAIDKANKYYEKETLAKVKCVDIGMDYRTIYKYICLNCGNSSDKIINYCARCGRRLEFKNE